jgi:glycosyltransferase involved in cell wall biosynthesis
MSKALVTVVVPTFNRARTIEAALESIQRQTCTLWEAIVVDDGSHDSGPDRVARLARKDSRIKLIRNGHNRGAQAARNAGIDAARTEWIAFLDSDDEWMPQSLELRLDAARKNQLRVVHTDAYVIRENGDKSLRGVPAMKGRIYGELLKGPGPMFQGLLVAKEAFAKIGGLDESIEAMQEWETAIRLAKHYPFGFLATPTFTWDCRGTDTITKNRRRDAIGYEQVVRKHFFSMLRTGPDTLFRHYRTLSERFSEAGASRDAFRSKAYARLWKFALSRCEQHSGVLRDAGSTECGDVDVTSIMTVLL